MFIKNRKEYLISENLKQAREYLTKIDIPTDNPDFLYIVDKLKKLPNLIDTFTRMVFKDNVDIDNIGDSISEFDRISSWIIDNKNIINQLPKNITQYKDIEELADSITEIESKRKVNLFYKSMYKSMRDEVDKLDESNKKKFDDLAISFMELSNEHRSMFTPMAVFRTNKTNVNEFMESLNNFIEKGSVSDNKKRVNDYIKDNKSKINVIYNKDGICVIQTNDRDAICYLGAEKWCIVYSPDVYQQRYIGENTGNTQYIIFNFNLPDSNRYSMFGVTINVKGESIIGGSQDKLNSHVPLNIIYEMTDIPIGTLISKYKSEYESLLEELEKITSNEDIDIEFLIELKNKATKLGISSIMENTIESYMDTYIEELPITEVDIRDTILGQCYQLGIRSPSVYLNKYLLRYINKAINDSGIINIDNIDGFIIEFRKILDKLRGHESDAIKQLIIKWFVKNCTDDGTTSLTFIEKIINEIPIDDIKEIIKSEEFNGILDSIKKTIHKSKETFTHYYTKKRDLLRVFDFDMHETFSSFNEHMSFSDKVFILYLYINNPIRLYDTVIRQFIDMCGTLNNDDLIEFINNFKSVASDLFKAGIKSIAGEPIEERSIQFELIHFIDTIINLYLNDNNITTFSQISDLFNGISDFISDHADTTEYISDRLITWLDKYSQNEEEIYQLISQLVKDNAIDPHRLLDEDDIEIYNISHNYLMFINRVLNNNDIDEESKDPLYLYTRGLTDMKYMDKFYEKIGLIYDKTEEVWYMETKYDTLNEYFRDSIDLESLDYYDAYYHSEYYDYIDDIDVGNLSILAHYFQSIGIDIDPSPLDRLYTKENVNNSGSLTIDYRKSIEIYNKNEDIKLLRNQVINIICDDDDDDDFDFDVEDLRDAINGAYSSMYNDAMQSQYFDAAITKIGQEFLIEWTDKKYSFGGSYLKWSSDSKLMIIPDMDTLFNDINGIICNILDYCGIYDMDIEYIILSYLELNGQINVPIEDQYVWLNDDLYDHFNELLYDNLIYSNIPDYTKDVITESSRYILLPTIIKFDEFK